MKATYSLYSPTEGARNKRTFTHLTDGKVEVWMVLADADIDCVDAVLDLGPAITYYDHFVAMGFTDTLDQVAVDAAAQAQADDEAAWLAKSGIKIEEDYPEDPPTYAEECDAERLRQNRADDLNGVNDEENFWNGI